MAQVDLTPASSGNTTGLHVHVPSGQSASLVNNPSDAPNSPSTVGTGTKVVTVKIAQANGGPRFSNPS